VCNVDHQFRIASERSVASLSAPIPGERAGVSMAANLAGADITQCVASCRSGDKNRCLDLGKGAIAALAPLGKFLQQADDNPGVPEGTILQKGDIITQYGGNPTKDEDPCVRSGVKRVGDAIENTGLKCVVRTKTLLPTANFKTRLQMQPTLRGAPSNWSASLKTMLAATPATLFPDRHTAPHIQFEGVDSNDFNRDYAGDVYAISSIGRKQIVLTTTNGCIQGYYEK
jgi:hypothetical protein